MFEQSKNIKCSNCGAVLNVKNSKNEPVKLITCPQCKVTLKVKFKEINPIDAPTYYPGAGGNAQSKRRQSGQTQLGSDYIDSGKTQLGGGYKDSGETMLASRQVSPNQAYLVVDGRKYLLAVGTNIVGRKADTSQATVQIETFDRYMSRQHAKIVVTRLPDGKLKAVISNDRNKNMTTIDGDDILRNDAYVLQDGDHIVMGKTTVTYREK